MKHLRLHFFSIILCLIFNTATAQQYNFKNYGQKNGLTNSTVNNIFQDSKGFMWFGTDGGGLSRFDYKSFVNYSTKDGLIGNHVTYVTEDKKGNIWIATSDGVSMFDGIRFKNYTDREGLTKGTVYWIYADADNQLWFAVENGGLNKYDGKKFTAITTKDGLPTNNVYSIVQDKKGDYWLGLSNGIAKYDGKKVKAYDQLNGINNKAFFSSFVDSKGNVWFSGDGIVKYTGNNFKKLELPKELEKDFITSIAEDKSGSLWFATSNHGALKYDGNNFYLFDENKGLSSKLVLSLYSDYEGNIWIGTQGSGVDLLNNESFVTYTDKQDLSSNKATTVFKDKSNSIIVGTLGFGLNMYNGNNFNHFSNIDELSNANIFAINEKSSELWIGTDKGAYVLDKSGTKYSIKQHISKLAGNDLQQVTKIIQDKKGNTWLATYGSGLFCVYKNNELTNYNSKNSSISDNLLTLFEDSKGCIWIGTFDKGVIKYDPSISTPKTPEKFTCYTEKDGLADKTVWSITEDENHNIYFGMSDGGLSCFNGQRFQTISTADGLCSNFIPAVQWDSIGKCLWLGTTKGINKLQLTPDFKIKSLRYYGEQEGYKGIEVYEKAILIDHQGLVWFGTNNGLYRYDRKYDVPDTIPPRIRLTDIQLAYQNVDWEKYADSIDLRTHLPYDLVLSHKNNHLTFSFQALTAANVKYTYILEGQNADWSPLTTNTEADFSNIAPGKAYTFKVKAQNSNGVWSKDVVEFTFTISPPWWQTWWFYTLAVLFTLIVVLAFVRYRTTNLEKEKKILEDKVTERTHELKEAIREITDSINYAQRIQNAILPPLTEVAGVFPNSFILFKPKDIVSGDFYWFSETENKLLIAAADCTGHGVPGAFMSTIGSEKLNEAVKASDDVSTILQAVNISIKKVLRQSSNETSTRDGMDIALCAFDKTFNQLEYAGANRPLWIVRKGANEIEETKATKVAIGGFTDNKQEYEKHKVYLQKGDTVYICTDGYADQFGKTDKKLKTGKLKETILSIRNKSMEEQKQYLDSFIEYWRGNMEQTDDILMIGIRI